MATATQVVIEDHISWMYNDFWCGHLSGISDKLRLKLCPINYFSFITNELALHVHKCIYCARYIFLLIVNNQYNNAGVQGFFDLPSSGGERNTLFEENRRYSIY